jgi:hypothetical protein
MNFLHYDVQTQSGDAVEVMLSGNAANVLLMDELNFQNYRSGRRFTYFGGYFNQSRAILKPPSAGHWHVVVDLGGGAGHVNAAVRVLRTA